MDALDREALDYVTPEDEDLVDDMKMAKAYDIVGKAMIMDELDMEALGLCTNDITSAECLSCERFTCHWAA